MGKNRAPRPDPEVCQQVSIGAARQRAVMIRATCVPLEMFHPLTFATAGFATGEGFRAVHYVTVATGSAVITQHSEAVAPHTARFAKEIPLRPTVALGNSALLTLLNRARGGWLNVTNHRRRRGGVTAPRLFLGGQ